MGQKSILIENFTDTSIPKIPDDPILTAGSLFLFDPTHSQGAMASIANGVDVPNIAWREAQAVLGSGTQTTLSGVLWRQGGEPQIKIERSVKGGIHVLPSQVNDDANFNHLLVAPKGLVQSYIQANLDHDIYFSCHIRLTRQQLTGAAPQSPMHKIQNTSNFLFHMQGLTSVPVSGSQLLGRNMSNPATTSLNTSPGTPVYRSIATTAFSGTPPAMGGSGDAQGTATSQYGVHFGGGKFDAFASLNQNKAPGWILERCYIEDLTVSGRTFAQVDDIDVGLWTAAHAAGGRYYADTWLTDPATFA